MEEQRNFGCNFNSSWRTQPVGGHIAPGCITMVTRSVDPVRAVWDFTGGGLSHQMLELVVSFLA